LLSAAYGDDANENQDKCPSDCKTLVSISPNAGAFPGQEVTISIAFNDSRYAAGHITNYALTIDGKAWNATNGCAIAGVNVTPPANGINALCTWKGLVAECTSTSVNGYLKVITKCFLPLDLEPTTHMLMATPTFYSEATTLAQGSTQFTTNEFTASVTSSATEHLQITGNVVAGGAGSAGSAGSADGGGVGGGTTLREAAVKFTTAQAVGMSQLFQDFVNWILSFFG